MPPSRPVAGFSWGPDCACSVSPERPACVALQFGQLTGIHQKCTELTLRSKPQFLSITARRSHQRRCVLYSDMTASMRASEAGAACVAAEHSSSAGPSASSQATQVVTTLHASRSDARPVSCPAATRLGARYFNEFSFVCQNCLNDITTYSKPWKLPKTKICGFVRGQRTPTPKVGPPPQCVPRRQDSKAPEP